MVWFCSSHFCLTEQMVSASTKDCSEHTLFSSEQTRSVCFWAHTSVMNGQSSRKSWNRMIRSDCASAIKTTRGPWEGYLRNWCVNGRTGTSHAEAALRLCPGQCSHSGANQDLATPCLLVFDWKMCFPPLFTDEKSWGWKDLFLKS